ncbi:MAG: tRNA (adenosine(37)-N6)-threonylcarbamoyltransferase complex ATPase subunit type 1 TsaE [Patescibacteria group bacterium]
MKRILKNLKETQKFACDLMAKIEKEYGNKAGALLVCLFGDLGAGKTALVKVCAEYFGIKEHVTSPTFVILKNYNLPPKNTLTFKRMVHIDAYRLENAQELLNLGWDEILKEKSNIIFLEWPEKVSEILPSTSVKIYLNHLDETQREIEIL